MKEWTFTAILKAALAGIIAAATTLFGGWDDAMAILTIFIALDIVSGWIRAICQKRLNSNVSFRGVAKKALIYVIVAVAAQADRFTGTNLVRNAVIAFYCGTEALSILENTVASGLPVPEFLKQVLEKLNKGKFPEG